MITVHLKNSQVVHFTRNDTIFMSFIKYFNLTFTDLYLYLDL